MPHAMFQTPPLTAALAPALTSSNSAPRSLALPSTPLLKLTIHLTLPFKCHMAGTFYRIPATGEPPPFIKISAYSLLAT
ncbi:hypothetical protein V6N11_022268 [Hibiscus sabdariffa]|uniref:Uncharacterized protein n=2 Tax=Hibiscus sabdariffa TaxID=183260 RepID=A0ABR1ZUU5_9ROSI